MGESVAERMAHDVGAPAHRGRIQCGCRVEKVPRGEGAYRSAVCSMYAICIYRIYSLTTLLQLLSDAPEVPYH